MSDVGLPDFKQKLDEFLLTIPDEPLGKSYIGRATSGIFHWKDIEKDSRFPNGPHYGGPLTPALINTIRKITVDLGSGL